MHCYLLPGRLDWNAKKQSEQQKIRPQGKSALWVFYPSVYRDPGDRASSKAVYTAAGAGVRARHQTGILRSGGMLVF